MLLDPHEHGAGLARRERRVRKGFDSNRFCEFALSFKISNRSAFAYPMSRAVPAELSPRTCAAAVPRAGREDCGAWECKGNQPLDRTRRPLLARAALLAFCFSFSPSTSGRTGGAIRYLGPCARGPAALRRLQLRGGSDCDRAAIRGDEGAQDELRKEAVTQIMAELFEQADAGNTTAMRLLGCSVSEGVGKTGKDSVLTFRCFLSSAQQGDVHAQYNLGVCYAKGNGVRQDQEKATKWFRAAAEAGDAGAMRAIAIRMSEGRGCAADSQGATAAFLRAAEAGDPSAEFNLGVRYASGHGIPLPAPEAKAFYLGEGPADGADRDDDLTAPEDALDELLFDDRLDLSQTRIAAEWYKRAASRGHCKAMYNLAHLMTTGKGVTLSQDGAIDLLRLAARKGYARAQYALFLQLNRQATDLLKERADEHAQTAAREAQEEGARWLRAAAENQYGKALYALGMQRAQGRGMPRNLTAAMVFFLRAHELRQDKAWERYKDCNETLARELFPEQLAKARKQKEEKLRRMYQEQAEAAQRTRTMFFPFARDQKRSRKLIAAALSNAEQRRQESLMVDMHEGLAVARRKLQEEGRRPGSAGEQERGLFHYEDFLEASRKLENGLRGDLEEEEADLPPWERGISRQLRRLDSVDPLASSGPEPRRSLRVKGVNKDVSRPFDDLMHRFLRDKISQLAPHPDAHKYLPRDLDLHATPTSPSASRNGERLGGTSAGVGGGVLEFGGRNHFEGGGSARKVGSPRKTNRRDYLAAFEDVVDVNALD